MPLNICELEIRIDWLDEGRYFLSARFMDPERDEENQLVDPEEIGIDVDALRPLLDDPAAYGERLTTMLFGAADSPVRAAYAKARAAAYDGLRVRLSIQASAPELDSIHWEMLRDPRDGSALLTQEQVWFARFASARDFGLAEKAEAAPLEALIVVASPSDLEDRWGLAPINADAEVARIAEALSQGARRGGRAIHHRRLDTRASVFDIARALRERYADILCLICHGAVNAEGKARLLLEADNGTAQLVDGNDLVQRMRDMRQRPRLVLMASCESAGPLDGRAHAAIGPGLAAAGVPSVIAMQGRVSQETAGVFMATLFAELVSDGQIDRAVAVARSAVRERPDWWMPVLFMRLKTGRLWPSLVAEGPGFDRWEALVTDIENGQCVPVIGPALVESTLGSTRRIAQAWAERYEFPLAPRDRDDLAQVAQYLTYRQSKDNAIRELRAHLVNHLRSKYRAELARIGEEIGKDLLGGPVRTRTVNDLIQHVGKAQRAADPNEVHALLAQLPVRVYISANRDNLLRDALIEAGKSPRVLLCNWIIENDLPVQIGPELPEDYEPSEDEPLVFHVFGNLEYPDSLVLTEDDYFDFLIAITRNETLRNVSIPRAITNALASSGLLLLGFQADDWDFRVLFRGIITQPGSPLGRRRTRVAVQMSPAEGQIIDPDRAIRYLAKYFESEGRISTFWGSAGQFMRILVERARGLGVL